MPKLSGNIKEIETDFFSLKKSTADFSELHFQLIARNPRFLKIFRLILGISLANMAILIGKTLATVSQYERGNIKAIPEVEAKRIIQILKLELPEIISLKKVFENYAIFSGKSKGGVTSGMSRAEKAAQTVQEKAVEKELKSNDLLFERNKTLETKIGPLNFDFVLENSVIECTSATNKIKAESLDFRIIKLKQVMPKIRTIAIVPRQVNNGFLRRLADFNLIVFDDELEKLSKFLVSP